MIHPDAAPDASRRQPSPRRPCPPPLARRHRHHRVPAGRGPGRGPARPGRGGDAPDHRVRQWRPAGGRCRRPRRARRPGAVGGRECRDRQRPRRDRPGGDRRRRRAGAASRPGRRLHASAGLGAGSRAGAAANLEPAAGRGRPASRGGARPQGAGLSAPAGIPGLRLPRPGRVPGDLRLARRPRGLCADRAVPGRLLHRRRRPRMVLSRLGPGLWLLDGDGHRPAPPGRRRGDPVEGPRHRDAAPAAVPDGRLSAQQRLCLAAAARAPALGPAAGRLPAAPGPALLGRFRLSPGRARPSLRRGARRPARPARAAKGLPQGSSQGSPKDPS